ncbi:NAD-dependent epimerase [Photobacterium iliopiscarium]|jgi:UDP-glucuronate 4-epimerase|uniref:NAD-dependent epimerase n=1 Tax=Photobacterium iliopiscarium TaxID=56192 RepID=A0A2T3MQ19_9GAMM|nr:NAD-dependent epimerase [Photobacterium iliopiscarium]KJG14833.1 protein CapI [Photobacterium iliopiscarium]PSU02131.1 NAD-dependent epimerase [Photobacterium iliopiscarium]PSV84480.1 NAD-dependent epimerase [Photobacterium iliopiscarium]PSV99049.1 NAD-dependent epimerase [Photobacterium iliopiscarium]
MKYLVTGAAGFIGAKVSEELLKKGHDVVGIDIVNDYYDVALKEARLAPLLDNNKFVFKKIDIAHSQDVLDLFADEKFDRVVHLAAQAGVRYSIENPMAYADSNLVGHLNILEGCRHNNVGHLVYASSSSVYGLNAKTPFSTSDTVDHPVSLYAATKKSNELMAHSYSHLYNMPTTGLRFFTVYGPYGRPDMAPYIFTKKILDGETIDINNNGDMWRDFTYIDDIVEGVIRIADIVPARNDAWTVEEGTPASSSAPYSIYNIGHGSPINLMEFIKAIETELGIEATKNFRGMQPGDVYQTYADTQDLFKVTGYTPKVGVKEGVANLVRWYKEFYNK